MSGEKEVAVTGRELGTKEGLTKKGRPEDFVVGPTESPVNIKVGSESAVASGTGPVLPASAGSVSEATKIYNKDIQERHDKELKKQGFNDPLTEDMSASWAGVRMVSVDGRDEEPKSGGGTFRVKDTLTVRRLKPEEEARFLVGATRSRRADDLVKGSGAGGGRSAVTSTATVQQQRAQGQEKPAAGPAGGGKV